MLNKWTPDQIDRFNYLRARNHGVKAAKEKVEEEMDAFQYAYMTVLNYHKGKEGQAAYQAELAKIREEVKTKSYSHSGSRVHTLIEMAEKMLAAFRETNKPRELTTLAGEIRDIFREIRAEVDPYGLENKETLSHFENIVMGLKGLPKKQQELLLGEEESTLAN